MARQRAVTTSAAPSQRDVQKLYLERPDLLVTTAGMPRARVLYNIACYQDGYDTLPAATKALVDAALGLDPMPRDTVLEGLAVGGVGSTRRPMIDML